MTSRLSTFFKEKRNILSVYLTAGYPELEDTVPLCEMLQNGGADMIEIGFPFSDPLADGPVIQASSEIALRNGMTLEKLFSQIRSIRKSVSIPLVLMGYINPVLQYGMERFVKDAVACGIDGVILPDLPTAEFQEHYAAVFKSSGLDFTFFITPQTSPERMKLIDSATTGFIYAVSSASITGSALTMTSDREKYFSRISAMKFKSPVLIGFGISDTTTFRKACDHAHGAIVGSAFIKGLKEASDKASYVTEFIRTIRGA